MNINSCNGLKTGFTLAEVLVTLAIIGVVAALTIPSLMQKNQDLGNYVKWKKEYSMITEAVRKLEAQNESIDFTSDTTFRNDFATVMNFLKTDTMGNLTIGIDYKLYKSTGTREFDSETYPGAIVADGSRMAFDSLSATCVGTSGALTKICGRIGVDVNGAKPPNTIGKDAFALFIVKLNTGSYSVLPLGSSSDGYQCLVNNGLLANSSGCSYKTMVTSLESMP